MSVTIVVTSYNDARTVGEAIASIAAQDGIERVREIALLDDGSTDATIERAQAAWRGGAQFTVVRAPHNLGPWPNLNRAMQYGAANGEWIIVFHADDSVQAGWLGELLERIEACPDDVASISSSWNVISEDGRVTPGENASDSYRRIDGGTAAVADTVMRGCWWKLSGAAIRARAFADAGPFDGLYAQCGDWEWLLRVLERGWAIEYIPRSLVNYRQHGATMSTRAMREDVEITDALRLLDRHAAVIPRSARALFLLRRFRYLASRIGRAVLNRDAQRVRLAATTGARIARSARRHLL